MKQTFFIFIALLFSFLTYSQSIVGKWQSKEDKRMGIIFRNDGTIDLIDLQNPSVKFLQNITLKYKVNSTENSTFLAVDYYLGDTKESGEIWKYRIENNILFIARNQTPEDNIAQSATTKREEEYVRID